jgi:hypothetical protein
MIASAGTRGDAAAIIWPRCLSSPGPTWTRPPGTENKRLKIIGGKVRTPNVHKNVIHNQTGLKVIYTETSRSCERLGCCRRGTSVPIDMESDVPRDLSSLRLRGWREPGGPRAWLQLVRRLGGRFNLGLPVPVRDEQSCQCRSSMIRAGPTPSQVEGARRLQVLVGSCHSAASCQWALIMMCCRKRPTRRNSAPSLRASGCPSASGHLLRLVRIRLRCRRGCQWSRWCAQCTCVQPECHYAMRRDGPARAPSESRGWDRD